MVMLSIEGLKKALQHVLDNSTTISYYERSSKRGLIVTDGMGEEEAYHIRVVELLQPPLITRLAESFTTLSLAGQELLDIISDDAYLATLTGYLKRQGYTNPSDRQVFRLLCERMASVGAKTIPDIVREVVTDWSQPVITAIDAPAVEFADTVQIEPAAESPTAEQLIKDTRKKIAK